MGQTSGNGTQASSGGMSSLATKDTLAASAVAVGSAAGAAPTPAQVAIDAGFYVLAPLHRHYKRRFGTTPGAPRRSFLARRG